MVALPAAAFAAAALVLQFAAAADFQATKIFSGNNCAGTPDAVAMFSTSASCADADCSAIDFGNGTYYISTTCNISDYYSYSEEVYGEFNYVVMEVYDDEGCASFGEADAFPASGSCEISSGYGDQSVIARLFSNGSATVALFGDDACGGEPTDYFPLTATDITSGECVQDYYKFYTKSPSDTDSSSASATGSDAGSKSTSSATGATSAISGSDSASSSRDGESTSGSGETTSASLSAGAIVGIVIGCSAFVFLVAVLILRWRRGKHDSDMDHRSTSQNAVAFNAFESPGGGLKNTLTGGSEESYWQGAEGGRSRPKSLAGLWDDETIATARIPREKVIITDLITRGGGGEVYLGTFNSQRVAIKMLLPSTRKSVKHVNAFLAEIKLMAVMEHPRIVEFVGVAWDSLTDLCAVSEYMEGGDLCKLMDSYEIQSHPVGFDRTKVSIALHVAHALTYLHSLDPPVLHRDLKSKNILLTSQLEAKLTDFGISREQADRTMTAGVGTSLWMAPEVMMGERYDDKADMFSFGVVLSELDVHVLPYSRAKENSSRQMSETVVLQNVALGKLRVEFSGVGPPSMRALGLACVSLTASERPTAAEALYELQTVLAKELGAM